MRVLTKVVASRSAVALSFADKENALDNLKALSIRSDMQLACIYEQNNQLFVDLMFNDQKYSCAPSYDVTREKLILSADTLEVTEPIVRNGQPIGWLLTQVGLSELRALYLRQMMVGTVVTLLSLALAFVLTSRLQRRIYAPIVRLGEVALSITQNSNYSIRAHADAKDEIGEAVSAFNNMLDLTEQDKRTMSYLNDSLTQAKENLLAKNIELEKALKMTQQAKNEVSEFTSMISHELRTPMAVLQCELELLIDGIEEPTTDNLNSLSEEVLHLNKLIQDMYELAMSDEQSLRYEMGPVSIRQIVEHSIERFEWQFKDNAILVSAELDQIDNLPIIGDPTRLKQVFDNVIKNSLSYTDPNGQLKLLSSRSNGMIKIEFQDSSPGVPNSALEKLCNRFYRVDESRSRETGGSGLGLAICKTIIEYHNGIFSVNNSPLGGLSVTIELPISSNTHSSQ